LKQFSNIGLPEERLEATALHTLDQNSHGASYNDKPSIVMITRNRGEQIRTALEKLLVLPERPKIIVVDNGSSDATAGIVREMRGSIEVIQLDRNLGCAGRNVGVLKAKTPYIAFSDDDSWWAAGSLARAVELFESNPGLGLIAARILVGPNQQLDPICEVMAISDLPHDSRSAIWDVGRPIVGFAACGAIVRREAFLKAGGFEQRLGVGGEETILALDLLRNGWQLAYVDEITAYHRPSPIRDRAKRRQVEVRNALWSAWLRRPGSSTLAETWRILKRSFKDQSYRAGFIEAARGLPWVLPARNPVSAEIDYQIKLADKVFQAYNFPRPSNVEA